MQYLIVLNAEEGITGYCVTVPDLPGCVATGDTLEEALSGAQNAVLSRVGTMVRYGQPLPEPNAMVSRLDPGQTVGAVTINETALDELREMLHQIWSEYQAIRGEREPRVH